MQDGQKLVLFLPSEEYDSDQFLARFGIALAILYPALFAEVVDQFYELALFKFYGILIVYRLAFIVEPTFPEVFLAIVDIITILRAKWLLGDV